METNTLSLEVTIASGENVSGTADLSAFAINKDNFRIHAIDWSDEWTTANGHFEVSRDGGSTWRRLIDAGGDEVFVVPVAGEETVMIPDALKSVYLIRLCSGPKSAPVNQAADRIITLILAEG